MKTAWRALVGAFSMFSTVPCPRVRWDEDTNKNILYFFPLVGLLIGVLWLFWSFLAAWADFPVLLTGAGRFVVPILITGGIHLDGYADTSDALASYGEPAKRRAILRDPHIGAFGVIRTATLLIVLFALNCCVGNLLELWLCVAFSFVYSRALSGLSVAALPLSEESSLARSFAGSRQTVGLLLESILAAALMIAASWKIGLAMTAVGILTFLGLKRTARVKFEGLSGDLNGWFLQKAELYMLLTAVVLSLLLMKPGIGGRYDLYHRPAVQREDGLCPNYFPTIGRRLPPAGSGPTSRN